MNSIGATGGVEYLRSLSQTNTSQAASQTSQNAMPTIPSDPQDQMDFISSLKADSVDGKVKLIINADSKESLEELKQNITKKGAEKQITADLPLINGIAVEVDEEQLGILPQLNKLGTDFHVWKDGRISIPDPIIETQQPETRMDIAPVTLGVDKLWEAGLTGKGSTICVIDTGIAQHPDLKDRIVGFKDFVNGKTEAYDDQGHGTHCAGIAAGDGGETGKYKGTAPEASIVGVKVLDRNGSGNFSDVIKGIQWAIENKEKFGIDVISMSLGGPVTQPSAKDPVSLAAEKATEAGIITVVAAGNEGPRPKTIGTPGNAENVITIGAMDDRGTVSRDDDKLAYFSSIGPTKFDERVKPDILAPGVNITAASHTGSGYVTMSGTSMATPFAAGVMALAAQAKPGIDPTELKEAAKGCADPLPQQNLTPNHQGKGVIDPVSLINTIAPELNIEA